MTRQVGAIPYRIRGDRIEIVLVTTRRRKSWIFPIGKTEKQMTHQEVAAMEAFEEAGVLGEVHAEAVGTAVLRRRNKLVKVKVFPIHCQRVLSSWPESEQRQRVVLSLDDALERISHKALRRCLRGLTRKVA